LDRVGFEPTEIALGLEGNQQNATPVPKMAPLVEAFLLVDIVAWSHSKIGNSYTKTGK
jgi:hypothetical protein